MKEGLTYNAALGKEIAHKSERNLRRALLMLETCRVQKCALSNGTTLRSVVSYD